MRVVITINIDNAAFGETHAEAGEELARILEVAGRELSENGPEECDGYRLYDSNGNKVGNIIMEATADDLRPK